MPKSTDKTWWERAFSRPTQESSEPAKPELDDDDVPRGVRIAGAWAWRFLVIVAAIAVIVLIVIQLRLIVIPLFIAVLVSALLTPLITVLVRHGWPRGLAIAAAILSAVAVVGGLLWLAIWQITRDFSEVRARTVESFGELRQALLQSPFGVTETQINGFIADVMTSVQEDSAALWSGALSIGTTLGHALTGVFLALFCLLFVLIDGEGIWRWLVRLSPKKAQRAIDGAGRAGWSTLTNYARTQILVASIDALGIGLGAAILGVPLAIPIAVLVFLGSFVPIVGAVVTGTIAAFIALVYNGWVIALIMVGVVLFVQQLEGHVLQPLLMGAAVKVHPLAVVLVVAAGSMVAGIPGALFAVPVAAMINVMTRYISSGAWRISSPGTPLVLDSMIWQMVPAERRMRRPRPEREKPAPATPTPTDKVDPDA
ncbi:putative PurR-regulated permease PerM [Okibacterium sp. HSC-33S16]|uniref:AI-2E family transporter n=1 Tax=Okibacterium sp. HSC-33S16 TaxID=2910965 RepID=UPI0020A1684B|nr:AI-2E family transporter [Okibacterium sp. HSC-33S16]MCP2030302.1 putative PurR-regulated permease PerM [Okibacterium sp. HSC-33S16]